MTGTYTVLCDVCHGRRHYAGKICVKCNGEGMIEIHEEQLSFSQATAKKAGKIVFLAVLGALVVIAALRYFGVL